MIDGQYTLDGYAFGTGCPVQIAEFDAGDRTLVDHDETWPARDGRLVGRDTDSGPAWGFKLRTRGVAPSAVLSTIAAVRAAWEGPRSVPQATSTLRYTLDGRTRLVHGRPRRFRHSTDPAERAAGFAEIEATFQLTDPLHYSDSVGSTSLAIVPPSVGGLQAPLAAPLSTVRSSVAAARTAVVGGDAPTPVRVVLAGPVTDPWVRVGGVLVGLRGSLSYDDVVTIDARTTTVLRADGASVAGMLAPRTRPLPELRLAPGEHEITFGGIDPTGTATAVVSWRDAWRSL